MKTVPNDRIPYLKELIRYSQKATLIIPTSVFIGNSDTFKATREALNHLKNDDGLVITEKDVGNHLTEIKIGLKDDDNDETID